MISEQKRNAVLIAVVRLIVRCVIALDQSGAFAERNEAWRSDYNKDITMLQGFLAWLELHNPDGQ